MEPTIQPDAYIRVRADKVSQLLDLVGELGLAVLSVTHHPSLAESELEGFDIAAHHLELLTHEVQDMASSMRLVPASQLFRRIQRLARDLSHQVGKQFEIVVEGEDVEIDKTVIDQLNDPLLHLIRNATDHGLEPPEERLAAGKPSQGKILVRATQKGQEISITVADDGRGLNREKIKRRAVELGLTTESENLPDATLFSFIFRPGFSTAKEVTSLSGRGVGMDVVQTAVRSLRGRIEMTSEPGQGTAITMFLPVTLTFLESLVVKSSNRLYTIPIETVAEVFQPNADEIIRNSAENREMVLRQGRTIPVMALHEDTTAGAKRGSLSEQIVVIVESSRGGVGFPVDEILGQEQVMMKELPGYLKNIRGGSGCALLGSGEVAIALDIEELFTALTS